MFRVKICGITSAADAQTAAEAGADAIGLNFYPPSPRYVDLTQAEAIIHALPAGVAKVGVFVNSPSAEVRTFATRLKLDYVQIHGDEPPCFIAELTGLTTIRGMRCDSNLQPLFDYLDECRGLGCSPQGLLVDTLRPGHYGGTGGTSRLAGRVSRASKVRRAADDSGRRTEADERGGSDRNCPTCGRRHGQRRRIGTWQEIAATDSRVRRSGACRVPATYWLDRPDSARRTRAAMQAGDLLASGNSGSCHSIGRRPMI